MVQILPLKRPSAISQLSTGAMSAAPEALSALSSQIEQNKIMDSRKNYYKELGLPEDLADQPESIQKAAIEKKLKGPSVWDESFSTKEKVQDDIAEKERPIKDKKTEDTLYDRYKQMSPQQKAKALKETPELVKQLKEDRESELLAKRRAGEQLTEEEMGDLSPTSLRSIAQEEKPVFEQESEKLAAQRSHEAVKQIEADYDTYLTEDFRLRSQEALAKKGELSAPAMIATMKYLGLPLSVLGNPDNELYEKVEADYVRDVSKVFPGQIRVFEIEAYLKTIPSMMNSDEGKLAIIENRKISNQAKKLKGDALKEIMKGRSSPPPNVNMLINEKVGDQLLALQDKYVQSLRDSMDRYGPSVPMKDPKTGRYKKIPPYAIEEAIKIGYKFKEQ